MFCCARVRVRQRRAGVLPRRARAAGDGRRAAPAPRCWRSCAATAGATAATSCTSASRSCSSASPPPRPSSTPPSSGSRPASRRASAPTRSATCARPRRSRPSTTRRTPARRSAWAPCSTCPRTGATSPRSSRARASTPLQEPGQGSVGSLIGGQPVSHVSMDAGVTRDVWTRDRSPTSKRPPLQRIVKVGNRTLPPEEAVVAIGYLARAYLQASAAGAVPLHRLAARDVDLDRRTDRLRRRPDRDLADPERGAPPRRSVPGRARRAGSHAPERVMPARPAAGAGAPR